MKLVEILTLDKPTKSKEHIDDYLDRLQKLGKQELGSGVHATVYPYPKSNKVVVKVSEEEKGPLTYLRYMLNNQHNPHVPKVYHVQRFRSAKARYHASEYYIAFLERLKPYGQLPDVKKFAILRKHFGNFIEEFDDFDIDIITEDLISPKNIAILKAQAQHTGIPNQHMLNLMIFLAHQDKVHANLDLHEGNVMLRGNVLVITDPLK